jgi:hypothetical protein
MASFEEDMAKTAARMSRSAALSADKGFTLIDWDDGHKPGGTSKDQKNPTKMAINHDKAGNIYNKYASNFMSIRLF